MKLLTENHLKNKYHEYEKIYTDASKEKNTVGIGIFQEKNNIKLSYRLNNYLSITTGELVAVKQVLVNALCLPADKRPLLCICTDSLGACLALSSGEHMKTARPDIVVDIFNLHKRLVDQATKVQLLWIPSHVDILGNEVADWCANEGRLKQEVDINVNLGYSELKSLISIEINEKIYQTQYDNNINLKVNKFKKLFPKIKAKINLDNDQYLLNRVRARADRINHFNEELYCRICRERLTTKHAIKYCKRFEGERDRVERELGKENIKFSLSNTLLPSLNKQSNLAVLGLLKAIDGVFDI